MLRSFQGQWWLVLDDEVVWVHSELSDREWRSIRESVSVTADVGDLEQGRLGERTFWQLDYDLGASRRTRVDLTMSKDPAQFAGWAIKASSNATPASPVASRLI